MRLRSPVVAVSVLSLVNRPSRGKDLVSADPCAEIAILQDKSNYLEITSYTWNISSIVFVATKLLLRGGKTILRKHSVTSMSCMSMDCHTMFRSH